MAISSLSSDSSRPLWAAVTAVGCATLALLASDPALARAGFRLKPAKIKQITKSHKSFKGCKRKALRDKNAGEIKGREFKDALSTCRERFPGAVVYTECKQKALRKAKKSKRSPERDLRECRSLHAAVSYNEKNPMPFFISKGRLFFAGIGLNADSPATMAEPPNFSCPKLRQAVSNSQDAQYLLFGNHPKNFKGLAKLHGSKLAKKLDFSRPQPAGVDIDGFGKIFGDPRTQQGNIYFPAAQCDFKGQLGRALSGLSAFYLINQQGKSLTPYFGIVYYSKKQRRYTTQDLEARAIQMLGKSYRKFSKSPDASFIASRDFPEKDDEGDPRNVCKRPRKHRFIAVIKSQKEDLKRPAYLLIANVKNLCIFGDKAAKRL